MKINKHYYKCMQSSTRFPGVKGEEDKREKEVLEGRVRELEEEVRIPFFIVMMMMILTMIIFLMFMMELEGGKNERTSEEVGRDA